jgi:hypothetical protein
MSEIGTIKIELHIRIGKFEADLQRASAKIAKEDDHKAFGDAVRVVLMLPGAKESD